MKIILVDFHILFRKGIASLLGNEANIEIIAEVNTIQEVVPKIIDLQPDLILMEFGKDVAEDLTTVRTITRLHPDHPIVLLSNHNPDDVLVSALRAGVKGFIAKDSSFTQMMTSIEGIQRGEIALSRRMTSRAIDLLFNHERDITSLRKHLNSLTSREMEILTILASGASNRAIAKQLSISENTVKIHVHKILKKLGVRNRREAARYLNHLNPPNLTPAPHLEGVPNQN